MNKLDIYSLKIKRNNLGDGEFEFVAKYDLFPNIIGVGDTPEEALTEAKIFLAEYLEYCEIEGIEVPVPEDNEWKSEFSGKITVRLPKSLHRDLYQYSLDDGMSINAILNDAIRVYLNQKSISEVKCEAIKEICDYAENLNDDYNQYLESAHEKWPINYLQKAGGLI